MEPEDSSARGHYLHDHIRWCGIVQAQDAEEEPTVYDLLPRCELSQFNDYADNFLPVFYDGLTDILDATEMDLVLSVKYLTKRGVLGAVGTHFGRSSDTALP